MRYKDLWYQVVPTNKIVMNNIKSKWHINNKSHECSLVINKTYLKIYEIYLHVIENTHYSHNTGKFFDLKIMNHMLLDYCITVALKGEFV